MHLSFLNYCKIINISQSKYLFKNIILPFALAILLFLPAEAKSSPSGEFIQGWKKFHNLCDDQDRAKYRSYWKEVESHFLKSYKLDKDGPYAPKSLYYLGRVYAELGRHSYLQSDFQQAIDYYQKMENLFPSHGWTDDCKLRQARILIRRFGQKKSAYAELLDIIHNYAHEDMVEEARKLLRKLDAKSLQSAGLQNKKNNTRETNRQKGRKKNSRLEKIRYAERKGYTRVVLDLKEKTGFENHILKPSSDGEKPLRLFFDLYDTDIDSKMEHKIQAECGLLRSIRTAEHKGDKVRVVLDLQELGDFRVFTLPEPFRLVVDLYPTGEEKKENTVASEESVIDQLGLGVHTVMIDPGHGGRDPGAVCNGVYEKDITLRMAKILGRIMREKGVKVLYTRTEDTFVTLEKRTEMANSRKADLFISLHINANNSSKVKGFELYSLNMAQSRHASEVAARENAISKKKISDLQVILTDLMLDSKIQESKELAQVVHSELLEHVRNYYSLKDQGVREAPFYVLMGARMPAVLVELGYLSNPQERSKLRNPQYLKRMAQGLVKGIVSYRQKSINRFAEYQ